MIVPLPVYGVADISLIISRLCDIPLVKMHQGRDM